MTSPQPQQQQPQQQRRVYLTVVNKADPLKRSVRAVNGRRNKQTVTKTKDIDADRENVYLVAPYTASFNAFLERISKGNKNCVEWVIQRMRSEDIPMDLTTYNLLLEKVVDLRDDISFQVYELFKEEAQKDDASVRPDLHTFQLLIAACERNGDYKKAFHLFSQMKELFNLYPDVALYNTLIGYCAPLHDETTASFIIEEMKDRCVDPDVHTYNCLMNVFSDAPYEVILQTFEDMVKRRIKPNRRTYNSLMRACHRNGDYDRAFQYFEELKKENLYPDVVTYNVLLIMCKERLDYVFGTGKHSAVRRTKEQKEMGMKAIAELSMSLFAEMEDIGVLPNTFTYNALIAVLGRCCDERVYEIFDHMKQDSVNQLSLQNSPPKLMTHADGSVMQTTLSQRGIQDVWEKGIRDSGSLDHAFAARTPAEMDVEGMLIVSAHTAQNDDDVQMVGDNSAHSRIGAKGVAPSLETFTTMIDASERLALPDRAYELFDELKDRGIKPNKQVYIKMMDVCTIKSEKGRAFAIFEEVKSSGISLDVEIFNALMNVLAECSDPQVFDVFEDLKNDVHRLSVKPDRDSYNILLKACIRIKSVDQALDLYHKMCEPTSIVKPDSVSYGLLMDVCSLRKDVKTAAELILDMKARGIPPTINTYTRYMNVFVQANDDGVVQVFEEAKQHGPTPNLDAYTTLLQFYLKNENDAIIQLFDDMKKSNVEPDLHAYNIMLDYCAAIGNHQKSFKYFEELKVRGLNADIDTYNALIAVFAPSGSNFIDRVFEEMAECRVAPDHKTFAILMKHKAGRSCLASAADRHLIYTDAAKPKQLE